MAGTEARGITLTDITAFESIPGKGVKGVVDDLPVALGNARLLSELGQSSEEFSALADRRRDAGETVMFVLVDGKVAGLVSVTDPIKDTTRDALKALHVQGLRIIMATGDNERTARAVAGQLGIDEICADVLPADKAKIVKELQGQGRKVAMAGDGVNDAPASRWSRAI